MMNGQNCWKERRRNILRVYDIVKEWHKDLAKRPGKRSDFGQTVTATAGDGSSTFKRLVKEE